MTDIVLESIRAVIVGIIYVYLLRTGRREELRKHSGWYYILSGFVLLLFGMIIDITDNYPSLNKYIIIGDTNTEAFLEKVVGYLCGFLLLAIGFWKWIPTVIALKKVEKVIEGSRYELELLVKERTINLVSMNEELESEIAERYRVENALRESEGKYQSLIANIPSVTWITDSKGQTTFISPNVTDIYGYTPKEISEGGKRLWFDRIHSDDIESVEKAYVDLFENNGHFDAEYRIMRKDGQWIWLHDRAVTTFEREGETYAYGVFTDITRRKRVEVSLEKSEEKYRRVVEGTNDAIVSVDSRGNISAFNKGAEEIFGYQAEEIIGKPAKILVPDDLIGEQGKMLLEVKDAGFIKAFETSRNTKNGTTIPVEMTVSAIKDSRGEVVGSFAIIRDITERKRLEQEREGLIVELQKVISEVKQLSGMLPICSSCKKIRNDTGYWEQVEVYIHEHSEAEFSHGMCPECARRLYPKYFNKID